MIYLISAVLILVFSYGLFIWYPQLGYGVNHITPLMHSPSFVWLCLTLLGGTAGALFCRPEAQAILRGLI